MGDFPLTPEELDALAKLDETIRADNASPIRLDPSSLPPEMRSVASALWNLNQSYSARTPNTFSGKPTAIGKYRIRSVLGVGGYGIVYLGDDPQLQRVVAIKVPLPGRMNDNQSRQRFLKEAKATAMLDHPNIVPVYDAGIDGEEVFLALAYCSGPPLDEWLKSYDQPMSHRLAAEIIQSLARAIDYSHQQGIIHRDLKPGNVLLFQDMHAGNPEFPYIPKITDFGLAKLLDDRDSKTATLQLQGTPQYMAPEQLIQGKRVSTPAIDIYSLGVLLYRMLVGRTPFQFESIEEAVRKIEFQRPVPPHVIQSNVPRDLSMITMKCLEKSPRDRYRTAGALALDLENFLQGRPVEARPPNAFTVAKHWCRERPVIALLLVAVSLLLTTFGALEYRYTRNVVQVNDALNQSRNQLLDQDLLLQAKVRELKLSLATSESQQTELKRRDEYAKQLIYAADVATAARAVQEQDPNRAVQVLSPYFSQDSIQNGKSIVPEFSAKHLWSQLRPARRIFPKDSQTLWTVAVSPDGKTVATAGNQGNIVVHDTREGVEASRIFRSEPVEINGLSYARDGRLLAAARDDGVVAIWDTLNEQLVRTFKAISGEAYAVRFLGDSHTCAVAGRGKEIFIWDADSGAMVRSVPVTLDKPVIECLEVSEDGNLFAVGGTDGHAHILDADGKHLLSFRTWGHSSVNTVCFVPNGPTGSYSLVLADKLGKLALCESGSDEPLSLSVHDPIQAIVHLGGGLLLCGDKKGGLSLFKLQRNEDDTKFVEMQLLHQWAHHDASLQAMVIDRKTDQGDARDGNQSISRKLNQWLYTVSRTGDLFRVDLRSISPRIPKRREPGNQNFLTDFADVEEDGSLVCQAAKGKIEWIEIPSGNRSSIDIGSRELTSVARVPGTSLWMVGDRKGEVATVDYKDRRTDPRDIAWKPIFKGSNWKS
ncbi:MAG: serine/threonine-protein kinase [Planctomycetota bacterium]|nr:serine/threonine-protein kinase [Planctomycetota bacterium]